MEPENILSLVVPCYNEEESIPLFYQETQRIYTESLETLGLVLEYVFVDDGSSDGTLRVVKHNSYILCSLGIDRYCLLLLP